jgi:hypothetical protein
MGHGMAHGVVAHNVNLNGNYANSIAMRELSAKFGHFTHHIKSADLAQFGNNCRN